MTGAGTFPQSSIPLDAEPDRTWCTCGTCGRTFPDIYPAARCPFEYDHHETETTTMPSTPATDDLVRALSTLGAERLARALVTMAAPAGATAEWDSETIEYVLEPLQPLLAHRAPWLGTEIGTAYWRMIADELGIQHDGEDEEAWHVHDRVAITWAGNPLDGQSGIIIGFTPEGAARLLLDGPGSHFAAVPIAALSVD